MQITTGDPIRGKIRRLDEIGTLVAEEQKKGKRIVHCHGVFDLLHPGHLRHLQEAKKQGDRLIVSVTPDRFVNKGPGRPAFHEELRLEQLAALVFVDYVVLNDAPDAISIIERLRPDVYVKGGEYRDHQADRTAKISAECLAVKKGGGTIYYTDDVVFSSSELLNRFFDEDASRIAPFIDLFKKNYSLDEVLFHLDGLKNLNVLVVGDAIIDEYQYVEPLGQSGKGVHLTARLLDKEVFLGGSLIIANHLSSFVQSVTLLTGVGSQCHHLSWMKNALKPNIVFRPILYDTFPTLTKTRFVLKDGPTITKLFETYSSNQPLLEPSHTEQIIDFIKKSASDYDLILVADFGNGFTNPTLIDALSASTPFLAINTQTNSGNRGYHVVTLYHRADFISLNEPELRLAAHDRYSRLESVASDIAGILRCPLLSITRGVNGVFLYSAESGGVEIPALTMRSIDRVGAGDSYFALASLCAAKKYPPLISGFCGSAAAAMGIQIVGNKESIDKIALAKYITRLLK